MSDAKSLAIEVIRLMLQTNASQARWRIVRRYRGQGAVILVTRCAFGQSHGLAGLHELARRRETDDAQQFDGATGQTVNSRYGRSPESRDGVSSAKAC